MHKTETKGETYLKLGSDILIAGPIQLPIFDAGTAITKLVIRNIDDLIKQKDENYRRKKSKHRVMNLCFPL